MFKRRKDGGSVVTRLRGEQGQSVLEFSLLLPVLAMLLIGTVKFGILLNNYITLNNAVAIGARTLAVNRGAGAGPPTACTLATTAIDNAAPNLYKNGSLSTPNPTFATGDTSTCTAMVVGDTATVKATYPCDLEIYGINYWSGCSLTSQLTIRIE